MKNISFLIFAILFIYSCSDKVQEADAWGNFEATEILVSAETAGRIVSFPAMEGDLVSYGSTLALIDTTMLTLQLAELEASRSSVGSRLDAIDSQSRIVDQQIRNLMVNVERTRKMLDDGAATQKQYDDLNGQVEVLRRQVEANNAQKNSINSERKVLDARKEQLEEQIKRCRVSSPIEGTVLGKFSELGELAAPGKPMLKLADLKTMKLKVYVSGSLIGELRLGSSCRIRIDSGEKNYREMEGTISVISDRAEFTPKIIQTKEERVNLVYAVTIDVLNDGSLKIGMPGEAIF